MRRFIRYKTTILSIVLICILLLCGCGGEGENPSDVLSEDSKKFAEGKSEITYVTPENPRAVLTDLIEKYVAERENPEPMEEDESQDIISQTDDDDKLDTTNRDAIGSDDDLQAMLAWMLDETKTVAVFRLANGYVINFTSYEKALNRAMRADPVDGICVYSYGMSGNTLVLNYSISTAELKNIKKETRTLVKQAVNDLNLAGKSDIEIITAVNEYLCDHNEYPDQNTAKYTDPWLEGYAPESHTAYALFKLHSAVCDGYARACKLLLDEFSVECIIIEGTGNGGNHAWNMIKAGGSWYHTDVCWNDGSWSRQDYLLLSDGDISLEHAWDTAEYPASAAKSYQF